VSAHLGWVAATTTLCLVAACASSSDSSSPGDPVLAQTAATARAVALEPGTATPVTILPGVARPVPTSTPPPAPTRAVVAAPTAAPSPTSPPRPPTIGPPTPSPTAGTVFNKDRPIVYAAIGASDTVGVGAPDPARDGWVPQLLRRMPPGSKLVNLGISGARLSDAVERELPRAIESKPDFVTVWNVVNDLNANVDLAGYERNLDKLLGDLVAKTPARVMVGNVPDLARVPAYAKLGIPPDQLRAEVTRWNAVIARSTSKFPNRVYLVDLYARSGELEFDPGLVSLDDFHPSAKGYARLADVFWEFAIAARLFPPQ
jgi:acyl-CoA thioesterase-1